MNLNWTDDELKIAIKAYFKMLQYQESNTPYVKAEENRALQAKLPNRTASSIEYRWQNISAVLNENKRPYVTGYLPAQNVGANVKERIWKIIRELGL